jgi:hypothetical protein
MKPRQQKRINAVNRNQFIEKQKALSRTSASKQILFSHPGNKPRPSTEMKTGRQFSLPDRNEYQFKGK